MDRIITKECPKHGITEHVLQTNGSYKCKQCRKEAVIDIRKRNKIKLVEYKGGKCEICGYDKCVDALEFHHINPEEKDFGLSNGDTKGLEKLKKEADKCILICSNCHRELHAKERDERIALRNKVNMDRKKVFVEKVKKQSVKTLVSKERKNKTLDKEHIETTRCHKTKDITIDSFIETFKQLGTFVAVGKYYGVSDKAIQKWCRRNDIPWRKNDLVDFCNKH